VQSAIEFKVIGLALTIFEFETAVLTVSNFYFKSHSNQPKEVGKQCNKKCT